MDTIVLIDKVLGGTAAAARVFGVRNSTVSGWKAQGRLPYDYRIRLKAQQEAAKRGYWYDPNTDTIGILNDQAMNN